MPIISGDDRRIIQQRIADLIEIANDHYADKISKPIAKPMVNFNQRGTAGGRCHYFKGIISFNKLLWHENKERMLRQTVGHEVAHHVAWRVYDTLGVGHGNRWKEVMDLFNLPAEVTHDMPTGHIRQASRRSPLRTWKCANGHLIRYSSRDSAKAARLVQMKNPPLCNHCGAPVHRELSAKR